MAHVHHVAAHSAAYGQLKALSDIYRRYLPLWTFPFLPLAVAAVFQSLAWMSGPIFFGGLSLAPRLLVLWFLALGEYVFMSTSMNAGVEVFGMQEPLLVVIYQVMTLVVFMLIDIFVFRKRFRMKYAVSFVILAMAVYVAYMW